MKSAFRILPILVSQRKFLILKAYHPESKKAWFFVEKNLPFRASSSCKIFQDFSDGLNHIIETLEGHKFKITNYLDDFMFIHCSEVSCNRTIKRFLRLCKDLGCPVALDKTEWASETIVFLGVLLNGRTCTLSVPEDKRLKAMSLLNWATQQRTVMIKFVQKLTGTLNFLCKAIIPGRTFTRMMYKKLKTTDAKGRKLKQYHHIALDRSFKQDCLIWKQFLVDNIPSFLCRPFVDLDLDTHATKLAFFTDALLNKKFGIGGVFGNRYFYGQWPEHFIEDENPSIEFAELLALVAGILTWGEDKKLRNTRVVIFCESTSVKSMVNNLTTGCEKCMKLIRLLVLNGLKYNRRVFVEYVKSKNNYLADPLSRMDFTSFWRKAPDSMNRFPDKIHEDVWPNYNVWEADI